MLVLKIVLKHVGTTKQEQTFFFKNHANLLCSVYTLRTTSSGSVLWIQINQNFILPNQFATSDLR